MYTRTHYIYTYLYLYLYIVHFFPQETPYNISKSRKTLEMNAPFPKKLGIAMESLPNKLLPYQYNQAKRPASKSNYY